MKKYDRTYKGFYGKHHTDFSKGLISEGNKRAHAIKRKEVKTDERT